MGSGMQNDSGISGWDFMLPLYLTDGQMIDLYIQVQSRYPIWVPVSLRTGDEYSSEETILKLVVGFISGGILLIFFYFLFMSLLVREKQFFFYGIFMMSILLMFLAAYGYTFALSPLIKATSFGNVYCLLRMIMFAAMYFAGSFLFVQPFGKRIVAICRWYAAVTARPCVRVPAAAGQVFLLRLNNFPCRVSAPDHAGGQYLVAEAAVRPQALFAFRDS